MRTIAVLALVLLVTACAGTDDGAEPTTDRPTLEASPAPTHPAAPTPEEVVTDRDAVMTGVLVVPVGDGYRVTSVWSLDEQQVVATSDDGFRTVTYGPYGPRSLVRPMPPQPHIDALDDLLAQEVHSFASGARGVIAGGDGATILPFERVARSTDDGRTWTTQDVPRTDGEMPFTAGATVLADGRLLVLIDHWTDDTFERPADRHHGFFVSAGADWSDYTPYEPTFRPRLTPDPHGWAPVIGLMTARDGGIVWAQTWDGHVYVSRDGSTYDEIPVR